jgi:hypothetical protein
LKQQLLGFVFNWLGLGGASPAGATKATVGSAATAISKWAAEQGVKGAVAGSATGGILLADSAADAAIVAKKAYDIKAVGDKAISKYCKCP